MNRRGRGRQHPTDLRSAYPGAVAGRGVVGTDTIRVHGALSRLLRGRGAGEPQGTRSDANPESPTRSLGKVQEWEAAGGPSVEESVVAPAPPVRKRGRRRPGRCDTSTADRYQVAAHLLFRADAWWRSPSGWKASRRSARGTTRARPLTASHRARKCFRRWRECRPVRRSARWCMRCWRRPTLRRPTWPPSWRTRCDVTWHGGRSRSPLPSWPKRWCRCTTPRWVRWRCLTLRQIGLRDRLRELDFEIPLAGGDVRGAAPNVSLSDAGELLRAHLPPTTPWRRTPTG